MATEEKSSQGEDNGQTLPPMTPAKRKRFQQMFEHANVQMRQENFDYATTLFSQAVLGDPGNPMYVQGFLANLKQKYNNNKKGAGMAFLSSAGKKGMVKKAQMQKNWLAVIQNGIEVLKLNPWDTGTLTAMATACDELGASEAQLHYLKVALEHDSNDVEINRICARALKDLQRYDEAIACWHRVEKAKPGDEEATRAIAGLAVQKTIDKGNYVQNPGNKGIIDRDGGPELTPEQRLEREIRRSPKSIEKYKELAELYTREELFEKAAEVYNRALQIAKGDIELTERLEDVQMRDVRKQLADAETQYKESGSPADKQRAENLKRAVFERELEFIEKRVQRYPNSLPYKFQLGARYQLAGRYDEAIAEFQQSRNDPKYRGPSVLALGQCFQRIEKYALAMKHYEEAIQEIPDRDADNKKKALYLAGKLAVYLGDFDTGDRYLTALAGMDFRYKDVSTLLDKLTELRENSGPQGDDEPQGPSQ